MQYSSLRYVAVHLRRDAVGVAREERHATNVTQVKVKEDDTLQTDSSTSVWWGTHAEGINVVLDCSGIDIMSLATLDQKVGVVDTLSSRQDLLTTHEEIVRVRVLGVLGVGHSVEGTDLERELVQHEEVSVVLGLDQLAELLLDLGRQVIIITHLHSVLTQQCNGILVLQAKSLWQELELFKGVLTVDNLEIGSVLGLQSSEDMHKQLVKDVQNLMVMLLESHLHIQPDELGHVAMSEGFLGTEDTADLEDALKVTTDNHLLVELRGLRQEGFS